MGYFTLGPSFCAGTPFEGIRSKVYVNAWPAVKDLVARARSHGIGVLIDFHALPGDVNMENLSSTFLSRAAVRRNQANLDVAQRCLVFMAQEAGFMDGVVGLQLCNEAFLSAKGLYAYYDSVIDAIAQSDTALPIYISDARDLRSAIIYSNEKNKLTSSTNPVIVDTHKYLVLHLQPRQK